MLAALVLSWGLNTYLHACMWQKKVLILDVKLFIKQLNMKGKHKGFLE